MTPPLKMRVWKLTPSILAKAFRGELTRQDPNDEPANALLERIGSKLDSPAPRLKNPSRLLGRNRRTKAL
jgi:type I restriction enzyme S subunit